MAQWPSPVRTVAEGRQAETPCFVAHTPICLFCSGLHVRRTFTDLKLVIDNRTYANIEGRWRDLFNKMKVGLGLGREGSLAGWMVSRPADIEGMGSCRVVRLCLSCAARLCSSRPGTKHAHVCLTFTSIAIPSVQWDIVKSVVKSVAGLQGRKFKVRSTHWATGNGSMRLENGGCLETSKQQA